MHSLQHGTHKLCLSGTYLLVQDICLHATRAVVVLGCKWVIAKTDCTSSCFIHRSIIISLSVCNFKVNYCEQPTVWNSTGSVCTAVCATLAKVCLLWPRVTKFERINLCSLSAAYTRASICCLLRAEPAFHKSLQTHKHCTGLQALLYNPILPSSPALATMHHCAAAHHF